MAETTPGSGKEGLVCYVDDQRVEVSEQELTVRRLLELAGARMDAEGDQALLRELRGDRQIEHRDPNETIRIESESRFYTSDSEVPGAKSEKERVETSAQPAKSGVESSSFAQKNVGGKQEQRPEAQSGGGGRPSGGGPSQTGGGSPPGNVAPGGTKSPGSTFGGAGGSSTQPRPTGEPSRTEVNKNVPASPQRQNIPQNPTEAQKKTGETPGQQGFAGTTHGQTSIPGGTQPKNVGGTATQKPAGAPQPPNSSGQGGAQKKEFNEGESREAGTRRSGERKEGRPDERKTEETET